MQTTTLDKLSALAQENRLALFRLLMRRYPDHVPAGELAEILNTKANTMSAYLQSLMQAGLINQRRQGRSLLYQADIEGSQALLDGLFADCCRGRPDICLPTGDAQAPTLAARKFRVLFLCRANSARSLMAEALLRDLGRDRFEVFSAGTEPAGTPNLKTIALLKTKGHAVDTLRSKHVAEFQSPEAPEMDFVFTVCDTAANEECPVWQGLPVTSHWGVPDPVQADGAQSEKNLAFQQAYGVLKNRLTAFVALDMDQLSRAALQQQIDNIPLEESL